MLQATHNMQLVAKCLHVKPDLDIAIFLRKNCKSEETPDKCNMQKQPWE